MGKYMVIPGKKIEYRVGKAWIYRDLFRKVKCGWLKSFRQGLIIVKMWAFDKQQLFQGNLGIAVAENSKLLIVFPEKYFLLLF